MTAAMDFDPAEQARPDPVTLWLAHILDATAALAFDTEPAGDAARIDRIALTERLQASLEAVKANEIVAFAKSQVAEQQRLDVDPRKVGRGIADQVALACKVSPTEGTRRLTVARDLVLDMPNTHRMLARGEIGGWTARLVTGELSHLDRPTRQGVDTQLGQARLEEKSPKAAAAVAQRLAYAADPHGAAERGRKARKDRRVTLRPAPDTMSILSGLLPVEQGVACLAALEAEAKKCKATGDDRTRGQIMADTLVERVTGQSTAAGIAAEVQIVIPVEALIDPHTPPNPDSAQPAHPDPDQDSGQPAHPDPDQDSGQPAHADPDTAHTHPAPPSDIADFGPVPAPIIDDLLAQADSEASSWRRIFTKPTPDGRSVVVDIDPRRRRFTGKIADLIRARDRHCSDPHCTAPIRHLDHIIRYADGGPSTADNGRGVCERGNYVREMPGWSVRLVDPQTHTISITTPTGHKYVSRPPEPP